jgi:N6-L-threonylcarbamoyladenine synthase
MFYFQKTKSALDSYAVKTLIIAGGVIANKKISEEFSNLENQYKDLKVITPSKTLSTDNSLMIAAAAYINILINPDIVKNNEIIAKGNIKLGEKL